VKEEERVRGKKLITKSKETVRVQTLRDYLLVHDNLEGFDKSHVPYLFSVRLLL
jgi:hypothetical protein